MTDDAPRPADIRVEPSRPRWPRAYRVVALLIVAGGGVAIVLLGAELFLRATVPIDYAQEHRPPHPVLGWSLEPAAAYTTYVPQAVRVRYNTDGWRDVGPATRNPSAAARVAVLGDSFIEAYSVDLEDSFTRRLDALGGDDVEIWNFGVGGYGTLQSALAFDIAGRDIRPDLVLLGFHLGNDLRNNDRALGSIVNTGTVKVDGRPFLTDGPDTEWHVAPIDLAAAERRFTAERERIDAWPLRYTRRSVLLRVAGRVLRGTPASSGPEATVPGDGSRPDARGTLARFGVHLCREAPEIERAWRTTTRILERLQTDTDRLGARLVVFTVPAFEEVDETAMAEALAGTAEAESVCLERAPGYTRLAGVLDGLGIQMVDLLPAFRDTHRSHEESLFRIDRHWNPAGHALAAEQVFTELVAAEVWPGS